ncbi:LSU ribosomal protein L7/L12 (P1/P2) [Thermogutta terrifontis]|uniref:Large ribosomal subunit protein bL12 n=1 Tax=Thermogutta terrifontis TaxID=1331910 RepID=A0A286RJH9_9BACT|nr:50S ribosomal protein L7/L12 [Thermogutta terrifontis]ASV76117.1 LSU ribosomal protein L7/L12 (P1/P2) [Thermogutta terrifontis]
MATDAPVREFSQKIKELGDAIVALPLKEVKELNDYLEIVHGIKPAAGGVMVAAAPGGAGAAGAAPAAQEKTEFDVILESFGANKLKVITAVRSLLPGISLADAKKLVESAPSKVKEGVSKEEAEKIKQALEKEGATVSIK